MGKYPILLHTCVFADNYSCPHSHTIVVFKNGWSQQHSQNYPYSGVRYVASYWAIVVLIVFVATTSVFGLIVIILGGLVTNFSTNNLGIFYDYAALGIATGLLTVLTLPVMFVSWTVFWTIFWRCTLLGLLFPWFAKVLSPPWSLLKSAGLVSVVWHFKLISNITTFFSNSGFLWIMWLAVGGNSAAGVAVFFFGSCSAFGECSYSLIIIFQPVLIRLLF